MDLEKQVASLELSKKLKTLGVKQESLFYWRRDEDTWMLYRKPIGSWPQEYVSAFTVAELGQAMINHEVQSGLRKSYAFCERFDKDGEQKSFEAENEADARAKMIQYLIENKLVSLEEINGRI